MKKNKKVKPKKNAFRILVFGVIICGSIITLLGLSISKVWVSIYSKYKEKDQLESNLKDLKKEKEQLEIDVEKMQDPEYVAKYLREKFFYSKKGEYIIRIPD